MLFILLLNALLGLSFTLGKITLFFASPLFIVGLRMILGGLGIALFLFFTQFTQYRPRKKDWPAIMQVTLFGMIVPYCLRAWGLLHMSSTKAACIFTLTPFFTALFSFALHNERLSYQKKTALLVGFLGMIPTLLTGTLDENTLGSISFFSLPEIAMLGASASFGYNFIALKQLVATRGCPAPVANAVTMLLGGVITMNLAFLIEPIWLLKDPLFFCGVLALQIIVSNFICANLQATLLKRYSPTLLAFASFLTPLCASYFGWLILNETVQYQYMISVALVMTGLGLFYSDERKTLERG